MERINQHTVLVQEQDIASSKVYCMCSAQSRHCKRISFGRNKNKGDHELTATTHNNDSWSHDVRLGDIEAEETSINDCRKISSEEPEDMNKGSF